MSDMFKGMPTRSRVAVFDNERACGFSVQWSEAGTGFGEFEIVVDKQTGEARCDLEGMSPQWTGVMLMRLVGTLVTDAATQEPQMVIDDPEIVERITKLTEKIRKPS